MKQIFFHLKIGTKKKLLLIFTALATTLIFIQNYTLCFKEVSKIENKFDWLSITNLLPHYVRPGENTTIFLPKNISAIIERQLIACFVLSDPKNRDARAVVRDTWGKFMKPIFVIGKKDEVTMLSVIQEAQTFNDIIIEDFVEAHVNLTLKTAFAMKSFLAHFKDSKYFFKIDDDMFLNVEGLKKVLKEAPVDALIGRQFSGAKPHRNITNRYYVPRFVFQGDVFPSFLAGPSYVIPGKNYVSNIDKILKSKFRTFSATNFRKSYGCSVYDT
jgi:Galactosyltransferase